MTEADQTSQRQAFDKLVAEVNSQMSGVISLQPEYKTAAVQFSSNGMELSVDRSVLDPGKVNVILSNNYGWSAKGAANWIDKGMSFMGVNTGYASASSVFNELYQLTEYRSSMVRMIPGLDLLSNFQASLLYHRVVGSPAEIEFAQAAKGLWGH